MNVYFYTLGCKVNQYESQAMSENLASNGYICVNQPEKADVIVVNSCTVTSESDRKTRQAVRRFKKNFPDSIIVLTGCMTQANPDSFSTLHDADIVLGNNSNQNLLKALQDFLETGCRHTEIIAHKSGDIFNGNTISKFCERDRAFVKIEDGCDRFCSYCMIPYARGRVRSKDTQKIKHELKALASNGFKEVVLVGINLSAYGKDIGKNLTDAVKIANSINGIERVRLGSIEPDHITDDIIDGLKQCEKFCPQFHLSLQSGCDKILQKMNRHYTCLFFEELCKKLRSTFKDATITTDIMVGFPTETDEDFQESVKFCEKVGFEKVHVFPYSVRKGTKAESMPQIEKNIKEKRAKIMADRMNKVREEFFGRQVGKTVQVLVESSKKGDDFFGYTKNYTPVIIKSDKILFGQTVSANITDYDSENCFAVVK